MILATERLAELRGLVAMVDGGFDPLHSGHVRYFSGAAELGAPVLCNIASDAYVERKHPVVLPQPDRAAIIDAIRFVSYVHCSATTTEEVLESLRPLYYVKGADWRDRLPDEQLAICQRVGTQIVYLDTVLDSSTRIFERLTRQLHPEVAT